MVRPKIIPGLLMFVLGSTLSALGVGIYEVGPLKVSYVKHLVGENGVKFCGISTKEIAAHTVKWSDEQNMCIVGVTKTAQDQVDSVALW